MRALLINPPDELKSFLGVGKNFVPVLEPLGLLYISAVCKQSDHDIRVIDAFAERLSSQEVRNIIAERKPEVVGFTSFVSNGHVIYELGKWIKNEFPEITVVFGNIHASVYAESYLQNKCCDIVVHGEGEYTFLKILNLLARRQNDFSSIPSISYLKDGYCITTSGPIVVEDLHQLPLPDREAVRQGLYNFPPISNMPYPGGKNSIGKHIITSRGCLFSCSFCVVHNKNGQRFNSISNVINEMEILVRRYSADYIFIIDPLFTSNKKRIIDICHEIKRSRLNFKWGCEGHVNVVDQEIIEEMESAGCYDIAFGIESGVQRLLDKINKRTHLSKIEETIKMVKRHTKIIVSGLFILGLPGETYQDSLETIGFAKMLPLDMAQFSILVPYPGSPIFYELKNRNEIDTGLRAGGALDVSVWLRYSPYIFDTNNEPIWVTPALSSAILKKLQKKALREFYFRPKQLLLQLRRVCLSDLRETTRTFLDTFF